MSDSQARKPLRKLFSWLFLAFIIIAFSQFLVNVLLVKFCDKALVGRFALANAITIPIFAFTSLDLDTLQITDAKNQYEFEDYFNLRLVTSGFALFLSIIIPIFVGYSWDILVVVSLLALLRTLEAISATLYGLIQKREEMKTLAFLGIAKSVISISLLGIILYLTGNLVLGLICLILFRIIYLFFYESSSSLATVNSYNSLVSNGLSPQSTQIDLSKLFDKKWYSQKLFTLTKLALPMGIVTLLVSFNANVPRYLIEKYIGEASLGVFASIASLMMIGDTVLNPLGASTIPRMSRYYAEGNFKTFWQILSKLIAIAIIMGVIIMTTCWLFGQPILETLYRKEYGQYTQLLTVLMLAGSIEDISSFIGQSITATRNFQIKMVVSATVVTISALLALWLIPSQGLNGAAIAVLIGSAIDLGLNGIAILYIAKKHHKNKLRST
ncbi:lipopolysaccharide biosynthesis protein [Pseudanabaena sp. ABRG5-3]|uniref:lipopolysaccharide biosynthesis protein n=1 Tax=Pseudanabaena sp. ABRG5-3 TaxID=685565 RepID=UPI000DC6FBF3|nr:oligosaccharide flippase family protein [Pseudanabaena sp. ABRG5-3]BBC27209.1 polysaccharide biosynthesis protein [Pseudanabaena sp. ABRG5-3]